MDVAGEDLRPAEVGAEGGQDVEVKELAILDHEPRHRLAGLRVDAAEGAREGHRAHARHDDRRRRPAGERERLVGRLRADGERLGVADPEPHARSGRELDQLEVESGVDPEVEL